MSEQTVPVKENKMGYMPIPKLLYSMALPMMASMMFQAFYNIVDSIFVARISEEALTAVSMAFPMQNMMIGVGTGIGVGMNALLSRKLGEKDFETANKAARHGIVLSWIAVAIFMIIGATCTRFYYVAQGSSATITQYGVDYLSIICLCSVGLFNQVIFERLLQSTGKTMLAMTSQVTGALFNIIFDPIMIFGLFGFPKMETAGAALATVLGQCVAAVLALFLNVKYNKEINISLKKFRMKAAMVGEILKVGIPSMIMVGITSITTFLMNKILMAFSSTAVAVFGAYYKLQSFIFMPIFGLNNGMVPIIAFNYGARKPDRIKKTITLSIITAMGIMFVGCGLMHVIPGPMLKLFSASDNMLAIGIHALRVISISFTFAGFSIICSSVFQSFGKGLLSMFTSIARQLVVLLPVAYLLSLAGKVELVWWCYPIAEIMSVLLCIIFLRNIYKKIVDPMYEKGV